MTPSPSPFVVRVRDLEVRYRVARHRTGAPDRAAASGVGFDIEPHGSFGLVGESGSGKSTVALALTRYLPPGARVTASELTVAGESVLDLDAGALRRYRRDRIGVVYQEPALALNPTSPVGAQVAEVYRLRGRSWADAKTQAIAALGHVGLPSPEVLARRFPHELSGGQQQRVVIAMALATGPQLLILDEPTTGLDTRVEADIFELIGALQAEQGFATLLISHDLPLVATHCQRVGVLKEGELVEVAGAGDLLADPQHPYSRELVAAVPELDPARPAVTRDRATSAIPPARPLLTITGVSKRYGATTALSDVHLTVGRGEVLGVVGESGSGKTTLGRAVAGLTSYEGEITLDAPSSSPQVQVVFQSPDASLNPRRTVRQVLGRSIRLLGGDADAASLAELAGLPRGVLDRLPHELSGGQKQRVAIARAFAGPVPLVVCDEPTSALDVTHQARILELLSTLRDATGVSYLFITHDLAVARQVTDRIAVLRHGEVVDQADTTEIFAGARHEYTESLIAAARSLRAAV
jgi:peptide/nickel transport system ATP-binding protein